MITCDGTFLGSSMVEHPAVNRVVAGSSPARGARAFWGSGSRFQSLFAVLPTWPSATSESGRFQRGVNLPHRFQPGQVFSLGAVLDLLEKLHGLWLVAGLRGIVGRDDHLHFHCDHVFGRLD